MNFTINPERVSEYNKAANEHQKAKKIITQEISNGLVSFNRLIKKYEQEEKYESALETLKQLDEMIFQKSK